MPGRRLCGQRGGQNSERAQVCRVGGLGGRGGGSWGPEEQYLGKWRRGLNAKLRSLFDRKGGAIEDLGLRNSHRVPMHMMSRGWLPLHRGHSANKAFFKQRSPEPPILLVSVLAPGLASR